MYTAVGTRTLRDVGARRVDGAWRKWRAPPGRSANPIKLLASWLARRSLNLRSCSRPHTRRLCSVSTLDPFGSKSPAPEALGGSKWSAWPTEPCAKVGYG